MIKNSTSVPQPVFLSDAAVEKAYNRAMGGVQLRSNALQGMISAGTKMGQQIAGAGIKYAAELEQNENEVAVAEYKKALSDKLFDYQERLLRGDDDLSTEEKLSAWCKSVKEDFASWHDEVVEQDSIREGAKRVGQNLKTAMTEDVERFVRKAFATKFRENRTRERDEALSSLQTQEAFATPDTFAEAKERALAKGATPEQVLAASIEGAALKIQSDIDMQVASLKQWGEQEFLLGRADAIATTIEQCIVPNVDLDGDGKINAQEAKLKSEAIKYANAAFSAGTESEQKDRRETRVYEFFAKERENLKTAIQKKHKWNVAEIDKDVLRRISELDTTKEGQDFVAAYFDGDVATAKKTMRERWDESKKQLENAWQSDYEKELKARNETQCTALAEALEMFLSGDSDAIDTLKKAGFAKKDGSLLRFDVLPDDTDVLPGASSSAGGRRPSAREFGRIIEACRTAYDGGSPEELAYVANMLFGSRMAFTNSDVRLISKVLQGAKNATPEQREYADRIYLILSGESPVNAQGRPVDSSTKRRKDKAAQAYGFSTIEAYDKHSKDAYFKELEKFYDFCNEFNNGMDQKGSTFRQAIEERFPKIEEAILSGATWDRRLDMLRSLNIALGAEFTHDRRINYKKEK